MLPILLLLQAVSATVDTAPAVHDALHYEITLIPADTGTHLLGEVQTTWILRSAAPVAVRLDSAMRVVRVLIDGKPNTRLSRTMYGRSAVDVLVPHQKQAGDSISTRIRYHGNPRGGMRYGPVRSGTIGRTAVMWAGADSGPAAYWLPVPDTTGVRAAVAFHVQAPVGEQVLAPGDQEKVDTLAYGRTTWHFRLDAPVPIQSYGAAVGPYTATVVARPACDSGCPAVEVWRYQEDTLAATAPFRRAGEIVSYYTRTIGPYPYSRLIHAEAAVPAPTAMAGVVLYPERSFRSARLTEMEVARETARQWLGLAVSPAALSDEPILVGFPDYLAALWRLRVEGDEAFRRVMASTADSLVGASPVRPGLRGAWVLHQLRGLVGDSAFTAGLQDFYGSFRNHPARASDLALAMSRASGRDLTWYFRQEAEARGVVTLEARVVRRHGKPALSLLQVSPAATETRFPGLQLLVDGRPLRVDVKGKETVVPLAGSKIPSRIELDPRGTWLVRLRRAS